MSNLAEWYSHIVSDKILNRMIGSMLRIIWEIQLDLPDLVILTKILFSWKFCNNWYVGRYEGAIKWDDEYFLRFFSEISQKSSWICQIWQILVIDELPGRFGVEWYVFHGDPTSYTVTHWVLSSSSQIQKILVRFVTGHVIMKISTTTFQWKKSVA